jgi:aryl-alcohol dehydrogenase-like predicted oxidoreductase
MEIAQAPRHKALSRRQLGRAGFDVTALTLGGAGLGGLYGPVPEQCAVDTVRRAFELGVNYIEGAPFYLECERRYGTALASLGGRPEGLRICTKVGMHPARYGDYSGAAARWSVEESFKILGVDSVDLVQVHATEAIDMAAVLSPDGAVAELERMRDEGKVGAIAFAIRGAGYHRQAIACGRFDALLIHDDFSLIRRSDDAVIAEAAAAGMGVLAGRALMTGLLAGPNPLENQRLASHPDAAAAYDWWCWARERDLPLQAVAIQFVMRQPGVSSVVVGASSPKEIEENVFSATFPLPPDIWHEVDARMSRTA